MNPKSLSAALGPLAPLGPGYVHFWIIDLGLAPRANWRVDRIDLNTNVVLETQSTDNCGMATFENLPYDAQQIHYFRVYGQTGVVHQVVIPNAAGAILLVQV